MITQVVKIHQRTLKEHLGQVSHTNPDIFENAYFYSDLWQLCWKAISKQYDFAVRIQLGSLSNAPDDGDGNENGKLQKRFR